MIRYAFVAALLLAGAACDAFDAGSNVVAPALDGGPEASVTPPDASLPACAPFHFTDGFENGDAGWGAPVTVAGATLRILNQDPGKVLKADLMKGQGDQRAYLPLAHTPTPCSGAWRYTAEFTMDIKDADSTTPFFAGPRLGGFLPGADAGTDPSRNHVEVGVGFSGGNVLISMTDDACDHLRCFDTPAATDLKVNAVPIGTGKHGYSIEVVAFAVPAADGYGSVTVKVDGSAARTTPLPYPMRQMALVTEFGASLSRADYDGEIAFDDVTIDFTPN